MSYKKSMMSTALMPNKSDHQTGIVPEEEVHKPQVMGSTLPESSNRFSCNL